MALRKRGEVSERIFLGGWRYFPQKITINLYGPKESFTVKENHIASVVSRIITDKHRQPNTLCKTSDFAPRSFWGTNDRMG